MWKTFQKELSLKGVGAQTTKDTSASSSRPRSRPSSTNPRRRKASTTPSEGDDDSEAGKGSTKRRKKSRVAQVEDEDKASKMTVDLVSEGGDDVAASPLVIKKEVKEEEHAVEKDFQRARR